MKTFTDWKGDLSEYLQIGDLVDQDIVDYFINVLPPATLNGNCIQIGEPQDHIDGRATYPTLRGTPDGWMYAGHCYRKETKEPTRKDCPTCFYNTPDDCSREERKTMQDDFWTLVTSSYNCPLHKEEA